MSLALLAALPLLLPLLAAMLIAARILLGRCGEDRHEHATARIALSAAGLSLLSLLALDVIAILHGAPGVLHYGIWFGTEGVTLPVSFMLDPLSLSIATLFTFIIVLTQRFSVHYMHREAGYHRFFMILSLFGCGMMLIVLAGNAMFTFVGWELAGVSSYLLIGFAQERNAATRNAVRAFVTNRIGDAGMLLGIALAIFWLDSVQWDVIGENAAELETLAAGLLSGGFVVAALAKSAQVPFAPWIARALEGPTPSSAIFYGSVMVHAGVYLLLRLEPVLNQAPAVMVLIAVLGLVTALYGYFSGLVQTDVKSALIFSTTTHVGLMFFACGMGWFVLAAWYLALHAAWRAYQFLLAPAYLHMTEGPVRPVAGWLARRSTFYNAAQSRFWLEGVGDWLMVRPTQALARDVNAFDEDVISRLVGLPEEARGAVIPESTSEEAARGVVRGWGAPGRLLAWTAEQAHGFEQRLVFQGSSGTIGRLLQHLGTYLLIVESLLQRPRYLLLLIMAPLVVII